MCRVVLAHRQLIIAGQVHDNILAGRHQIRFDMTVRGYAIGGKAANHIIGQTLGATIIGGAHGNDKRIIGWREEFSRAIVTGGDHDHNAVEPQ